MRKPVDVLFIPDLERYVAVRVANGRNRRSTEARGCLATTGKRRTGAASPRRAPAYDVKARAAMPDEESKSGKQKSAEAEVEGFRKDLGPFVVAAETTRMPMVFMDANASDKPIIFANDSFLTLTGYSREDVVGQSFEFLMAPGSDARALAQIEAAFAGTCDDDPVIGYRRHDGSVFCASTFITLVPNERGDVIQHFASFVDLTKERQEQERLRFLLGELNHRTQNALATVLAIAWQTFRGIADDETINSFEGRILALAKTHSLLGTETWDKIGLYDILHQTLKPFAVNDSGNGRFSIEGDDVRLHPNASLTLALVFHELATNALKHGALSSEGVGHIDIGWQVENGSHGKQIRLSWRESGGPPVSPPVHRGFGTRLIERALTQQLGGEVRLDFEPAGVVCEIVMPLSQQSGG